MRDLKYLIVKIGHMEVAILFNGMINHCDMVPKNGEVVSGGFCNIFNHSTNHPKLSISVFGNCTSLNNLESRSEDTIPIAATLLKLTM